MSSFDFFHPYCIGNTLSNDLVALLKKTNNFFEDENHENIEFKIALLLSLISLISYYTNDKIGNR